MIASDVLHFRTPLGKPACDQPGPIAERCADVTCPGLPHHDNVHARRDQRNVRGDGRGDQPRDRARGPCAATGCHLRHRAAVAPRLQPKRRVNYVATVRYFYTPCVRDRHSDVPTDLPEPDPLRAVLDRLVNRDRIHSEATVQSDIRQLLLTGGLGLEDHDLDVELETQVPGRRRIDIEVGYTVIEVKKDLRKAAVVKDAVKQLAGYVASRSEATGQVYVGVLTDGAEWRAYNMSGGELTEAARFELKSPSQLVALLAWLEDVLKTKKGVRPTPGTIAARLGATSLSYALDKSVLAGLYADNRDRPGVKLKRELWGRLLRSALGTQFTDTDELFVEHTLLVNSAEIIAHLVLGLDATDIQPVTLLKGGRFALAQVYGVVDDDFFDWVLEAPDGPSFVRTLARDLTRFDWAKVEHDVLKVLYESVIGSETRKRLGEYYTPDWLADQVVETAVTSPLAQRVVDPACGSGTFLFHAVRRYLDASDKQGTPLATALAELTNHVLGIDLHPVAVALARVTYLLAIGRDRLIDQSRGPINVPVYLGDSIQWTQRADLFSGESLLISTGTGGRSYKDELKFPEHLLADAGWFDRLIDELATLATNPRAKGYVPPLTALYERLSVAEQDQPTIKESFEILCKLHDDERNHIWSYYIRNLVRPVWLARPENRVDVLVGNPPWLAYRNMPGDMQKIFQKMSDSRGLWHGRSVATHQDLSALFVARAVEQYLKNDGSFAFVLPNAALDRGYYKGFRSGQYADPAELTTVSFTGSWDLRRIRPHFFPRGGSVVFGTRTPGQSRALPSATNRWSGTLPRAAQTWEEAKPYLHREDATLAISDDDAEDASPYGDRFSNGANIFPRLLFFVEPQPVGPLGVGAGRLEVRSASSSTEKKPWKDLPRLSGVVETEFVRPVLLGESVLPYRIRPAREAVLPLEGKDLLDTKNPRLDLYPGLAEWWRQAEQVWNDHRASERYTLLEQIDFRGKLTGQLPVSPLRVLYTASGMHIAAALTDNRNELIEHKLYWATVSNRDEGYFLCAILNCPEITQLVRPLMSYGKDERDIDKAIWKLPIPMYDPANETHQRLSELGRQESETVAALDLDETGNFTKLRQIVRRELASHEAARKIAEIVTEILG